MDCGFCGAILTPAEVLAYETRERDFEAFERSLYATQDPIAADEPIVIPDAVPPEADRLILVDGQFI
jgi:hypothetical protein